MRYPSPHIFWQRSSKRSTKEDVYKLKDKRTIIREFDKINGLPAYSGIIDQKRRLAVYTAKQAKKHQVNLSPKELRVNTRRKIFKVFS